MRLTTTLSKDRVHYKNYLLLLIICLLAYWPLTLGIFSVKNDAIHYFLPYRFAISEALRNGEGPFWSPYLYLGNPIQGDMQSGAWNPVVWIFSAIGRYDLTLFHYEYLLYIFLGGAGMYKLTNRIVVHADTALLIAVSYMLSGFMLGGQLINWLAAAAFLPFVIHYFLLANRTLSAGYAVKTGLSLYLLFTAGYPSFFILTGYLLVILFIIKLTDRIQNRNNRPAQLGKFISVQLLVLLVFAGLSVPAIVSYIDLLPYYQRGSGTSYQDSVTNAFDVKHFLSLLFPFSIKANNISSVTDITCRNIYFGLFPLLFLFAFPPKRSLQNILLLLLAVFALLFSLGDSTPVRKICYGFIPLMDTFRHPSQMRLFFILAILLLAAPGIKRIMTRDFSSIELKKLTSIIAICGILLLLLTIFAFGRSNFFSIVTGPGNNGPGERLKNIFESASLANTVAINGVLQLCFIALFIWGYKKLRLSTYLLPVLWITNMVLMAQLVLPASFVSKVSPAAINKTIHASPRGFPVSDLQNSLADNSKDAFDNFAVNGLNYFYNKKIGISKVTNSPAFLTQEDQFIQTILLYNYVASMPVAYFADSVLRMEDTITLSHTGNCHYAFSNMPLPGRNCTGKKKAHITAVSSTIFEIETESDSTAMLVLTQNYYPDWHATIDNTPRNIMKVNMSFMGVIIPPGKHKVQFRFVPIHTKRALGIQLVVLLALLCGSIFSLLTKKRN